MRAHPSPTAGPSSRATARATPGRAPRRPGRRCRRSRGSITRWQAGTPSETLVPGTGVSRVGSAAVSKMHTTRAGWPSDPTSARSGSSTSCTGPPRISRWTSASSGGREAATNVSTGRIPAASASSTMSSPWARNWPSSRRRRVAWSLRACFRRAFWPEVIRSRARLSPPWRAPRTPSGRRPRYRRGPCDRGRSLLSQDRT